MNKSFTEIFANSLSTFKKSFLAALGIFGIFLCIAVIVGIIFALIVGQEVISGISNPAYIMAYLSTFAILFFAFFILYYIFYCWVILVVRNNALVGKSFFKETFFEAARKIWKVLFAGFLMGVVFVGIGLICSMFLGKYGALLMFPVILIITPSMFAVFYGVLCREGNFWDIISEAVALGFNRWGRVVGYFLLFMICYFVIAFVCIVGVTYIAKAINMSFLGGFVVMIFELALILFANCFATVFYLDLAGIQPQMQVSLEQPVQEQITQTNQNML